MSPYACTPGNEETMAQNLYDARSAAEATVPETGDAPNGLVALLGASSRSVALLAAWIATCGSLFFSEVLHWTPCVLCWYQRILMYPLSIVLTVGLLRRDRGMHLYVLPFSLIGACVSLYHYLLQKTDWLPPPACSIGVPCNVDYINVFGFITIPFLALTAFLIISLAVVVSAVLMVDDTDGVSVPRSQQSLFARDRIGVFLIVASVILGFVAAARLF
jgi:disulfide bond formation protein DsbB